MKLYLVFNIFSLRMSLTHASLSLDYLSFLLTREHTHKNPHHQKRAHVFIYVFTCVVLLKYVGSGGRDGMSCVIRLVAVVVYLFVIMQDI